MALNFSSKNAKVIAEIQARTCIDQVEAEIIKELLQAALNEYCSMLDEYYEEDYYNALASARSKAYDDGFDDGYDVGYDNGYSESHSAV